MFDYKNFRAAVNVSQVALANLLGCGQSYISQVEREKTDLSEKHYNILVQNYGEELVQRFQSARAPRHIVNTPYTPSIHIPLIHIDSVGGMNSTNDIINSPEFVERYIPFADAQPDDVAIYQSGESMAPTIPAGSILHIRRVHNWQEYFGYGNYFVLVLADGRRITKQVIRCEADPQNYVICKSINPSYSAEELPRKMILAVWKIINVLTNSGW